MRQNWQWTVVFITGFRLFMQAILLEREAYSACWLAPVGGFVIALPVVLLIARHWQAAGRAALCGRACRLAAVIYLLVDTAQMVLLYQEGTKFASLSTYPTAVLYLLLLVFALFVMRQPAAGIFGIGAALKVALVLCLGALILFRLPDARIARLTPILGGGAGQLLASSLSLAGYGFPFLIWLSCAPDLDPKPMQITGMWAVACAGAALFTGMECMLSPVTPGEPAGMYLAVGRLLTSGRSQTSLQLVLYMVWFALLFAGVCLNLKCMAQNGSALIKRAEKLPIQLAVLLSVTTLAILCEHMMGKSLNAFLDSPGAYRSLLLGVPLLMLLPRRRAVTA